MMCGHYIAIVRTELKTADLYFDTFPLASCNLGNFQSED